jgi:hypothetical protein
MKNLNVRSRSEYARQTPIFLSYAGWALFTYWWVLVLVRSGRTELPLTAGVLAASTLVAVASTSLWIRHNLRRAGRGTRGAATLYIAPRFEYDRFRRAIVLEPGARDAAVVILDLEQNRKVYRAEVAA